MPICGTVSQISPPIRIALIAAVAFLCAYMLFLRPKVESAPPIPPAPTTAPGVKGLTNAVGKAKEASKASDAANAKIQSATGGQDATATSRAVKPAGQPSAGKSAQGAGSDTSGLPVRVQKALDDKKILVLFFYNLRSADDRAVLRAVKRVDRWQGEVVVQAANVRSIARYSKITQGADVQQTPSVVVVDRNAKAVRLDGYVDTRSIDQAVVDAMRNSGVLIKSAYLRKINDVCRVTGASIWSVSSPTQPGAELRNAMHSLDSRAQRLQARFKAVPAPARWRAFKHASVADLSVAVTWVHGLTRAVGSGHQLAPILSYLQSTDSGVGKAGKRFDARMDKHHVLSCGSNF